MRRSAVSLLVLWLGVGSNAQQPRDNRRPPDTGMAAVGGYVLADEAERVPLRRTRVTITSVELEFARTVITGDDGAFRFDGLPPGHYSVMAAKDGYITTTAGARRVGRLGSIELSAGATSRIDLRMAKGAVITGRILNPDGEPAQGLTVAALRQETTGTGERRLVEGSSPVTTDDRGEYRIFGLPPGTYYVRAQPRVQMGPATGEGLHLLSDAEIRAALAEVKTEMASSRPGIPVRPRPSPAPPSESRRAVTLASVFFPGTATFSRATGVSVKASEVRTGVDFDVELVPIVNVEGYVAVSPDAGRTIVAITTMDRGDAGTFLRTTGAGTDGRFTFRGIPPGAYTIMARVFPAGGGPGARLWGTTDIVLSGDDLTGVTVPMQPALTIAGRIVFDASSTASAPVLPATSVSLEASNATFGAGTVLPPVRIEGDSFMIADVTPGIYRTATMRGIRTPLGSWWLKSILVNRKEWLDEELDLRTSSDDAIVTFSARASELSGTVRYASGLPVRDEMIYVFSANPRHWFPGSRRTATARPSPMGGYVVRNLPPGEYFVAVTGELFAYELADPDVLRHLTAEASRVRIAGDERVVHNIDLSR